MAALKEYVGYLRRQKYDALLDGECLRRLDNVVTQFDDRETHSTILEFNLSDEGRACDYSFQADGDDFIKEYWFELDFDACDGDPIRPCFFADVSKVKTIDDLNRLCLTVLPKFATVETINAVKPMLEKALAASGKNGLYQIGSMAGRDQNDSLRIFIDDAPRGTVLDCLRQMNWRGDFDRLEEILSALEPFALRQQFNIDFDVFSDRISDKIGINLMPRGSSRAFTDRLLGFLQSKELCTEGKRADVLRFIEAFPQFQPYIQNDIAHFKLPFEGGRVTKAKAYLRQGDTRLVQDFRAYEAPALMNLELTTKCPLHCPQCYCDLSTGRDMDKTIALHWIKEAARVGVKTINLSGGETLIYPHLIELIEECRRLKLEANVAISGVRADRQMLQKLIEAGVKYICVSLNGSTEEINRKSRDGYELAIKSLETLKSIGYQKTMINWVMHSFNADDFSNIIMLAERLEVFAIDVMMFKPDKNHQLPSVPTKAQLLSVAKIIKQYKGKVLIETEPCFSQMRALVGERFFFNQNVGISRGCGAGRDGMSVSVDGFLTPCRHLYTMREEYDRLDDYWSQSPILQRLRTMEDRIEKPCTDCKYKRNCLPCAAAMRERTADLKMCDEQCPLGR